MNKEQVEAKREEIRDAVAKWLRCKVLNEVECKDNDDTDCIIKWEDCNKFTKNYWLNLADEGISILSSLGVMLVGKEDGTGVYYKVYPLCEVKE